MFIMKSIDTQPDLEIVSDNYAQAVQFAEAAATDPALQDSVHSAGPGMLSVSQFKAGETHAILTASADKKVTATTEHAGSTGTVINYSGATATSGMQKAIGVNTAQVERTFLGKRDPRTGEIERYCHTFRNPKAAQLITKLAVKRLNSISSEPRQK